MFLEKLLRFGSQFGKLSIGSYEIQKGNNDFEEKE